MTTLVPLESIFRKIVFLRGKKVLLDRDLAGLYYVETKQLKRAVRSILTDSLKTLCFNYQMKNFKV